MSHAYRSMEMMDLLKSRLKAFSTVNNFSNRRIDNTIILKL